MEMFLYSVAIVAGLGLLLGAALAIADKFISVPVDETEAKVLACLSGANCGSCGYAGCGAMAKALTKGEANINKCTVASNDARKKIAEILGQTAEEVEPKAAFIGCKGGNRCMDRAQYDGITDCRVAAASSKKGCSFGCIGLLTCMRSCPVGAISMNEHNAPEVNMEKCISCGLCTTVCPRSLITLKPLRTKVYVGCSSGDKGKKVMDVCSVGCIGCGLCAKACEVNAISMLNNKPVIDNNICVGCGKCKEKCPRHALY